MYKLPRTVYLAFSGGIDSCVLLDILIKRKFNVVLLFVDHNTQWCNKELAFTKEIAKKYNIDYIVKTISLFDKSTSLECFWSKERNKIFQSMDRPVLTGHHLDDAVEWYVMSTFQGTVKLLDYQNKNVLRPLLITDKETIISYSKEHNVEYISDPSNKDISFNLRNKVRLNLLPNVFESFPGLRKTVKKLILFKESKFNKDNEL
jgi:tRNA(Ile)-lysidine synthase